MSLKGLCTCEFKYITSGTYWLVSLYWIHQPSIHWSYTRSSHVIITSKCSLQLWNLSGRGFSLRFLSSMCNMPFCVYLSAVLWWRKYQYFHHKGPIKWFCPNSNKQRVEMVKILHLLEPIKQNNAWYPVIEWTDLLLLDYGHESSNSHMYMIYIDIIWSCHSLI